MSRYFELGRVVRLQVAPEVPKASGPAHQIYDPAPLLHVDRLLLHARGVSGVGADEQQVLDVHHQDHPRSRFRGDNALSIGFTAHYALMRRIFGPHLTDGCAAENILIEADERIWPRQVDTRLILESADGTTHDLGAAIVAEPCAPFARWALSERAESEPEALRSALQDLRSGTRGFYLSTAHIAAPIEVRLGDRLLACFAEETSEAPR